MSKLFAEIVSMAKEKLYGTKYGISPAASKRDNLETRIYDLMYQEFIPNARINDKTNKKTYKFNDGLGGFSKIYDGAIGLALHLAESVLGNDFMRQEYGKWEKNPEKWAKMAISYNMIESVINSVRITYGMSREQYIIQNANIPDKQFTDPVPSPDEDKLLDLADQTYNLAKKAAEKREFVMRLAAFVARSGYSVHPADYARLEKEIIELKEIAGMFHKNIERLDGLEESNERYMDNLKILSRDASEEWKAKFNLMFFSHDSKQKKYEKIREEIDAVIIEPITTEIVNKVIRELANEEYERIYAPENITRAPKKYQKQLKKYNTKYGKLFI